jgi:hypothetical protein
LSALAWIAFIVCSIGVWLHYLEVKDSRFLMYAIPGLILLIVIPMTLAWMSRRAFTRAERNYGQGARAYKIGRINTSLSLLGEVVIIRGEVQKISFKWLNRPHYHVKDDTGTIRVIMFTAPAENIEKGATVEALGTVIRNVFDRRRQAISAVSIKKQISRTKKTE